MTELHGLYILCTLITLMGLYVSIGSIGGVREVVFHTKLAFQIIGGFVCYIMSCGRDSFVISWEDGDKTKEIHIG